MLVNYYQEAGSSWASWDENCV